MQAVIGKKFAEYTEFVKLLTPNIHFEPDLKYSSLMFYNTDTGEQVRDEIVEGEEYGVLLNLYPAAGYRLNGECRVITNGRELIQYSQYLIYNEPLSYVELLLSGMIEEYLRNSTDYTPLSETR